MAISVRYAVIEPDTRPYQDQKPGTSGLRKKVPYFQQENYLENFIQSVYDVTKPTFVVLGGDGRFWSDKAIIKIIDILIANGVEKIVVPANGILSTPAASALIRKIKANIGIILTASHNPGGPEGDFGVKINTCTGAPALESITNKIYEHSKTITSFKTIRRTIKIPFNRITAFEINHCKVAIIDPVSNYAELMTTIFSFAELKTLFEPYFKIDGHNFKMLVDCMNGVTGPYVTHILGTMLGAPDQMLINTTPLPDFGGKHPDPNLTHAKELVDRMKADPTIDFGIAFDGDGDRNMVLGSGGFFVSPGDSLAIIAKHCKSFKPYVTSAKGFARSFPTAPALDRVCKKWDRPLYETPTGWKFFGELLDQGRAYICGEESFGIGSSHVREKDGIWACLCWLTIMRKEKRSMKELVQDHWREFGRDYFNRYDYEDCDGSKCQTMINELSTLLIGKSLVGKVYGSKGQYVVTDTGDFEYVSKQTGEVTSNQGLFIKFEDESRIIIRLSGTGTTGVTVRLYLNAYSKDDILQDNEVFLKELLEIAYSITKLREYTGKDKPDVIT